MNEKLAFLGYSQPFNSSSRKDIALLVCWLEDMKIRAYEIEERNELAPNGAQWTNNFNKYLSHLCCPWQFELDDTDECINWLLSYAISLEYEDLGKHR